MCQASVIIIHSEMNLFSLCLKCFQEYFTHVARKFPRYWVNLSNDTLIVSFEKSYFHINSETEKVWSLKTSNSEVEENFYSLPKINNYFNIWTVHLLATKGILQIVLAFRWHHNITHHTNNKPTTNLLLIIF